MKFYIDCFWKIRQESLTRIMRTLHEQQYTFTIISRSIFPRMKNVSDKICRENQHTFNVHNFFFENCAVCEII